MKTQFIEVAQFGEDFDKLKLFAKTFNHDVQPIRNGRIFAFERGDKTFGYAEVFHVPVAFPAFHPELTSPRGVVEVVEGWKATAQLGFGGDGFIAVPLEEDRTTFPRGMLEGQGFQRWRRELYYLENKG